MSSIAYSKFACIGTGVSAIGLGATLRRWYNETDIQFFERSNNPCGTWSINQYPGCACDVPSALYSLSYEQNTNWSRILPTNVEIERYLLGVAAKYDLISRMKFQVEVRECRWVVETNRWRLSIQDLQTGQCIIHECTILFSAAGQLVYPRKLDVPGIESFQGDIFHSARWKPGVDLRGKDVVVFGNGCTAAQIVPAIVHQTKTLTQIVRAKHWIFPPIDMLYPGWLRWAFKRVPLLLRLHRLQIFMIAEWDFYALFPMTTRAAGFRASRRVQVEKYMRKMAPPKYHNLLIPDFDVGCKRRIFDNGYLESLHTQNLTLTNAKALEIVPDGVQTNQGHVKADVIIMANGFVTNEFISPLVVVGRNGKTLTDHWKEVGGPEAYNCSVVNGFPNFFMILGPNAATGHTSAIMASENTINYAMRVLKPLMSGNATTVEIRKDAELQYASNMQNALRNTVWSSGCQSWYVKVDNENGKTWNAMSYPYSQAHFWYRSLLPVWQNWEISASYRSCIGAWFSLTCAQGEIHRTYKRLMLPILALFVSVLLLGTSVDERWLCFGD